MKITSLDIQQQQFKGKMFGGLDQEDVDAFLQNVAAEMENLIRENNELKEQQSRHKPEMIECAEKEQARNEVIRARQRTQLDQKKKARKEADLIITEAELKAERVVADAERQLGELKARIEDVRRQKIQFEMSLKALLDSFSRQLSGDEPA